jgi:hypothetical protein
MEKLYLELQEKYCYICYSTDECYICDRCEEHYCYECAYTFTIHYQYEGNLCYHCSDQRRKTPLTKELKRELKIKYLQSSNDNSL